MMVNINNEQQTQKHGTNNTSNNNDNDIRSHSGSFCLAVCIISSKMKKHEKPKKPLAKAQMAIPGDPSRRRMTYLHRTMGDGRRDTTPQGFVGNKDFYDRERLVECGMPRLMGHPEASDEGTCYPISTHEQMEAAYERVGASCQMILDLHDRLQGKQLKAGLSLKQVVEFQNELVDVAEHIMTVTTSTHEAQRNTSEVREADHEISAQIQLILLYLICGT